MASLRQRLGRFAREEGGAGTAMALSTLGLMLILVALAVDVANLTRYRAVLQLTADSAAHAGMVALAESGDPRVAEAAARRMVERNLPEARHGLLVAPGDIRVVFHDAETNRVLSLQGALAEERVANAVVVRLQRSHATNNLLPTLMMRTLGRSGWTLAAASVATAEPTRRCAGRQAMVAQGGITLGQGVALEAGLCLHSQAEIALGPDVVLGPDPALSLPDATACTGPCPAVGTGGLVEANLILDDVPDHVWGLAESLLAPQGRATPAAAFFADRPLADDLEPLREVGVDTDRLETGAVVELNALQFSSLRTRPAGLIYAVMCSGKETSEIERRIAFLGQPDAPSLQGAILVTNCPIEMDALTVIEGAVVIALHPGEAQITAAPGARIGAPRGECDAARHATLMVPGGLVLDGRFTLGDATLVAGGDIVFRVPQRPTLPEERVLAGLSLPSVVPFIDPVTGAEGEREAETFAKPANANTPSRLRDLQQGLTLFAGGRIDAEGELLFAPCPDRAGARLLTPPLRRIAHVLPDLGTLLPPVPQARDARRLPGEAARSLTEPVEGS